MDVFKFSNWPIEDAIVTVLGSGKRKMAVFEDPNCGYCQRFNQQTLTQLTGTTVYTFLYPFLSEDSFVKSAAILASENPTREWNNWMLYGKAPEALSTQREAAIIARNLDLGKHLDIQGTPAVFFEDGEGPFGYMPIEELLERFTDRKF